MKNAFFLLSFFLLCLASACVVTDDDGMVVPTPDPEPASLRIGLLFHVPFSGNADDVAVGGLTGTVSGATITTDRHGEANEAYSFDGIDDVINYGTAPDLSLGDVATYTMTAWIKPEDLGDTRRHIAISKFNGGVAAGWYLAINSNREIQAYRNNVPWSVRGNPVNVLDEYVHIASSYDGANLTVYRNGELDATIPFPRNDHDRNTQVLIGGEFSQNNIVPSFKGVIDDVRIYNRVLTSEELTWLATN